jgi:hypothetical protein
MDVVTMTNTLGPIGLIMRKTGVTGGIVAGLDRRDRAGGIDAVANFAFRIVPVLWWSHDIFAMSAAIDIPGWISQLGRLMTQVTRMTFEATLIAGWGLVEAYAMTDLAAVNVGLCDRTMEEA